MTSINNSGFISQLKKITHIFCFQSRAFYDTIQGMKTRMTVLSSLLCLYGAFNANASECIGAGCDIEPTVGTPTVLSAPVQMNTVAAVESNQPRKVAEFVYVAPEEKMVQAKMLSIKPVPEDTRPKLWDGVHGEYGEHGFDKTVDWRNGVPIWDDSISNYKYKDFSDWFLEPTPEIYVRDADASATTSVDMNDPMALYAQNMEDAAATRARVEELLAPKKPSASLWFTNMQPNPAYTAQDMTTVVEETFGCAEEVDDGCPFESKTECEIWRRKPIVRESVAPRSPTLRDANMDLLVSAIKCNPGIDATNPAAAPLLDRYKMLMRSAQACCTDGMAYALKSAGATDGLVYKFMADDANFYGLGGRCLMMTDHDFDTKYPNTATAAVAADVRNGCLCRGRQWFQAMLAPFKQAYAAAPEFKDSLFNYTYTDGLQRRITVSINNDVQNVLKQLEQCP